MREQVRIDILLSWQFASYAPSAPAHTQQQQPEMAEGEPARVRSDSNGQGDPWPVNLSISTTSSGQMMASSGGSDRLDAAEVPSPPLALISSRVKSANALETCANFETATVRYAYETTSPSRLLRAVGEKLRGRKALSVALVVHGSPGCFKLCSQKV